MTDKAARAARRAHAALDNARVTLWTCLSPTTEEISPATVVEVSDPSMDRTFAFFERCDPEQPERWRRGARIRLLRTLAARRV